MNKLESLRNLRDWDFNVSDFVEYNSEWTLEKLKARFGDKRIGLRTCLKGGYREFNMPFFKDMTLEEALPKAIELKKKYIVILYEYIHPDRSEISGNIQLNQDLSGQFDIFYGSGVVREVETRRDIGVGIFPHVDRIRNSRVKEIVDQITDLIIFFTSKSIIVEFSWGSEPAGIKNEQLVLWEIRLVD